MKNLHTVLGATGATGKAVIEALQTRNLSIRGVGRSIQRTDIQSIKADLLDKEAAEKAIKGSAYVYLCVGLPYSSQVWQRDWTILMQNVIDACAKTSARLIFLDNIYMYRSPLPVPFDENTVQAPTSKKGQTRKATADLMLEAMQAGKIKGVIGRSADFFGKGSNMSSLYISFLERMLQGKAPQWLGKPNKKHTYSVVSDNARALVALAFDENTYGQVWHLPVGEPITIEEMTAIFNRVLDTNFKVSFIPIFIRKILSLFVSPVREISEMMYQFDNDYVMSAEKFHQHFPDFKMSSYEEGIREMVESFK